jgi:hypothetical protein
MSQIDFLSLFYNRQHTRNSFITNLEGLLNTEYHKATFIPYGCELPPDQCFIKPVERRSIRLISNNEDIQIYELRFFPRKRDRFKSEISGKFFIMKNWEFENAYSIITIESQEFLNRALLPFIQKQHPNIYMTWINQTDLKEMLEKFTEEGGYSGLTVLRASLMSRFISNKNKRESMIPSVSWPHLGLEGAFELADEQDGWFNSITFAPYRYHFNEANITVTRKGIVKTDSEVNIVFQNLLQPIHKKIQQNLDLFKNRNRYDNLSLEVKPLAINFGHERLKDSEERIKLIEAMRSLENSSVSVLHNNPYLQMSVIDYKDGSTFDIWVTNADKLVLVPQFKGSIQAIRRIVGHIFDNYAEGIVLDYQITV